MSSHIQKSPETLTSKERTRRFFARERPDRVTIGYETNPGIHARLARELGLTDYESVLQALGVDFRPVNAPYTGAPLFPQKPDRVVDPLEGYIMREVANESGSYTDYCEFRLRDAGDTDLDAFPIQNPDDYDYSAAADYARAHRDYGLYVGNPGIGCVINCLGMLFGMDEALMRLVDEDEAMLRLWQRKTDAQLGILERTICACKGLIDFIWLGEDLGTQHTPMISADLYRQTVKPYHKQFCELADAYHLPVMIHTCGSSSWAYEDFIGMGVDAVDTLQPEAANMSPRYLVDHFGGRLSFRGCISTAGPVAYGTPEDTRENVRDTLEIMMPTFAYQCAPTHCLQDNSPTENVIAMYQAIHDFGSYRP